MKARYDNHDIDRKFKPGDKVLALLPIPGRPLQARYFGHYPIDKKKSDLNYTINTPGRRKNKQMFHVNMLKNTLTEIALFQNQLALFQNHKNQMYLNLK